MLTFDSVKLRLEREQSLSYMEFNYMILQAYDFYQLYKTKNCVLQIGGSDQWGNIVNGVELIRRMLQKESFGLTSPLITLASGAKMGKTEKGAIWLNEDLFSPYDYWQFWRNTDDRDVKRFLNFFTEIESNEINNICNKEKNINNLKIILANEATKILHGEIASKKAEQTAKETFESGGLGSDLPEIKIKSSEINKGLIF
jgi:tyrosyl-tRNA synthetase